MHPHYKAIQQLGGVTALAKQLGIPPRRASHWPKRGIPPRYWPAIAEVRSARRLGITAFALMVLNSPDELGNTADRSAGASDAR